MNNTEKRLAELAIFWQEIADNLPKSLERSALGDEKMFLAFASVYPKMAEHLEQEMLKRVVGLIEEIRGMEGESNQALDYLQDRIEKDILSSLDKPEKQKPFYVKTPLELDIEGNQIRYPLTDK